MELIDIVDENDKLTGRVIDRKTLDKENLWHRVVSCWIMNNKGEILLQRRALTKKTNPGKWGKTGGHVDSGETTEAAIIREVKEELGIDVPKNQAHLIDIFKSKDMNDKYFGYNYIFTVDYEINDYILQTEEVDQVKYVTIEEMEKIKRRNDNNYVFSKWTDESFFAEMTKLKNKREELALNK